MDVKINLRKATKNLWVAEAVHADSPEFTVLDIAPIYSDVKSDALDKLKTLIKKKGYIINL